MKIWKSSGKGRLVAIACLACLMAGCGQQGYSVLAVTSTIIGVDISQNLANQAPQAKLGYNRTEFAFVPTNRNAGQNAGQNGSGAADCANVLMELRYGGIFDWGASSGIYQRLAVGTEAVHQPGASMMFAKNDSGEIQNGAANALQALSKSAMHTDTAKALARLNRCYAAATADARAKMLAAAGGDFVKFVDGNPTLDQINAVLTAGGCK